MRKIFIFLILFIIVFWIFWIPGVRVANDYHLPHIIPINEQIIPWIWRETNVADGLGEYTGTILWVQPLQSFHSLLSALSVPPQLQTKLLGSLVFIIGFFSLSKLLQFFYIKGIGKYLGILFYLTNSYFLLLFDGGQISLTLVYAISPLVLYFFLKIMEDHLFKYKLYLALSFLLVSILDIRFIYVLAIIIFLSFIFNLYFEESSKRLRLTKEVFISAIVTSLVLIFFHIYWLLPLILLKFPQLPQTYERVAQVDFLSFSSVGHSMLLQQPHWYKNIFGQISSLRAEFIFIPILVFLAPLLRKRDKVVGFWLIIACVGIFLGKGSNEPFGQIYPWLFTHIPGFSLFRDPTKFFILICLAYSILLAITIQEIKFKKNIFLTFSLIYLLWLMRPVYLGQMTGLLSFPVYWHEYSKLAEYLRDDKDYSRVFWIPTKAPLGYASNIHPQVEASRFAQKRPFAAGISGSYETFNYIRDPKYMGEIFDVAGIGYVAYPLLDPRRDNMHPDNIRYYYLFLDQLSKLPWLSKVDNSAIPLLKTAHHQDKFFVAPNVWWVIGSDDLYNESTKSAQLSLSKNSLIFAEEYSGLGERIDGLGEAKIVLNNKTILDLAATFIQSTSLMFPAKKLDFAPDKSGWWKREAADLIRWREFLQIKYGIDNQDFDLGGGWVVGEGNRKLKIDNGKLKIGNVLLARVLESTRSGSLSFSQDNNLIGQVDTKKPGNNIRWFEVGELKKGGELEIKSSGDINVVNTLAVLDKNEWLSYQDKAKSLENKITNFTAVESNNIPTITYQKINPTKYIVHVSNLTKPAFLVFSQNYDSLWRLNNQTPLPVYSLLNGFKVDKDGQYTVEFEAQKYVFPGLIISAITVFSLLLLLIRSSKKL